jgi:hypothetical protein
MTSPTEKPGQGTEQSEQQIREQRDRGAGQHKPEIERTPGLTEQQQDEQRERDQDVREELEDLDDNGKRRDNAQLPPNPD